MESSSGVVAIENGHLNTNIELLPQDHNIAEETSTEEILADNDYSFLTLYTLMEAGLIIDYYRARHLSRCYAIFRRTKESSWILLLRGLVPKQLNHDKKFEAPSCLITWPPLVFNTTIENNSCFDIPAAFENFT